MIIKWYNCTLSFVLLLAVGSIGRAQNTLNYQLAFSVDANTAALWHFDENSCAVGNSIPPSSYTAYDATTQDNDVTLYCGGSTAVDGVTRNNGFNAGTKQFGTSALDILASRFFGGTTHRNYEVWTGMNRSSLAIANNLTAEGWFYITGHCDPDNNKNATLLAKAYANKIEGVPIADTKEWLIYAFRDTGVSSNDRPISADIIDVDGNTRTVRSSVTWGQILNKWVHIAMSYSGTELKLHIDVNGDITAATATFGTSKNIRSVTDSAVTFLADPYGSLSTASIGKVDEVRISNVVRSFPPPAQKYIDVSLPGKPFSKGILGHTWGFVQGYDTAGSYLGPAGGGMIDGYNWKDLTAEDEIAPTHTTLTCLREARDRNIEVVGGINCEGIGHLEYPSGKKTFILDDQDPNMLTALAADWVRYVNYTVQTYRQGDMIPAGRDLTILNSIHWPDPNSPKLLGGTEPITSKITYWQLGNEVEPAVYPIGTYQSRYKQITQAMLAEDSTIKVGPCGAYFNPGDGESIHAVLRDPTCRVDFVSHHPYAQMGRYYPDDPDRSYWGNIPKMENCLRGLNNGQWYRYNNVRNVVASCGRDPDSVEYLATEYNPMGHGWLDQGQQKSQYQALGVAETIFAFIDIGYPFAHFWLETQTSAGTKYPSHLVFDEMRKNLGNCLIDRYSDGNNIRLYTTRNNTIQAIMLWGLNFDNDENKTLNLGLSNLSSAFPGSNTKITLKRLNNLYGVTTLMLRNLSSVDKPIDWTTRDMTDKLNLSNFNLILPAATITLLVVEPYRILGDANSDGMVDVGDLGILAANYGSSGKIWEQGDFNGDGVVDVADLGILAANFGYGTENANNFSDNTPVIGPAGIESQAKDEISASVACPGIGLPFITGLLLAVAALRIKSEE